MEKQPLPMPDYLADAIELVIFYAKKHGIPVFPPGATYQLPENPTPEQQRTMELGFSLGNLQHYYEGVSQRYFHDTAKEWREG